MRRSLAALLLFGASAHAADGWRHGGTPVWPDARPPATLHTTTPLWTVATPSWGNSSPVRAGAALCMTSEPTWVHCHDAATGKLLWQASNDRLDTLAGAERAQMAARLAEAPGLEARIRAQVQAISRLRRDVRRAEDPDAMASQISVASAELDVLKASYDELHAWLTPPELDIIGWASPTLATDGRVIVAVAGNGVVSAFEPDGTRRWSVWLGPPVRPMRGFDYGSATSPLLVDGLVIVGHQHLTALRPTTGEIVWQDAATWDHYGTPAVARVGDLSVLVTPDGRVLRARDGQELARGLGDIPYVGPIADGDHVWFAGGAPSGGGQKTIFAAGWVLEPDGKGGVQPRNLFRATLPYPQRIYVSPVVHDGLMYTLLLDNTLLVLDAATGAVRSEQPIRNTIAGGTTLSNGYGNPTIAGGQLWLSWEQGVIGRFTLGDHPQPVSLDLLPAWTRSTVSFEGNRVYVRTLNALSCFGG